MNLEVLVSSRRVLLLAAVVSMFIFITALPAIAQLSALSSIRGTVTDATGAALLKDDQSSGQDALRGRGHAARIGDTDVS